MPHGSVDSRQKEEQLPRSSNTHQGIRHSHSHSHQGSRHQKSGIRNQVHHSFKVFHCTTRIGLYTLSVGRSYVCLFLRLRQATPARRNSSLDSGSGSGSGNEDEDEDEDEDGRRWRWMDDGESAIGIIVLSPLHHAPPHPSLLFSRSIIYFLYTDA